MNIKTGLSIPPELHAAIKSEAEATGRSFSAVACERMRRPDPWTYIQPIGIVAIIAILVIGTALNNRPPRGERLLVTVKAGVDKDGRVIAEFNGGAGAGGVENARSMIKV
jgi:hypothetical protein